MQLVTTDTFALSFSLSLSPSIYSSGSIFINTHNAFNDSPAAINDQSRF